MPKRDDGMVIPAAETDHGRDFGLFHSDTHIIIHAGFGRNEGILDSLIILFIRNQFLMAIRFLLIRFFRNILVEDRACINFFI